MDEPIQAGSRSAAFRLEFGGSAGWGHLIRCSALAAELSRRGWKCSLWSAGDLAAAPADVRDAFSEQATAAAVGWSETPPDVVRGSEWVVVDHHAITDEELKRLREVLDASGVDAPRLLAIDDECHRRLGAASLALNTRPGLARSPYAAGVRALLGESYALLRPGLRSPEAIDPPWPDDIDPVLVMIGGTDPRGLAAAALHALADVDAQRYAPVLVQTRAADDGGAAIEAALARFEARVWVSRVDACALAGWARVCRWSISACGSTIYELSFLGLPFVGIIAAENQRAFAREIENRWAMPVVEGDERLRASAAGAFRRLVAQPFQESWRAIDGLGARRVADAMEREDHASSLVAEPVSG